MGVSASRWSADARAVGRRGSSEILFWGDSTARLTWEAITVVGGKLTRRVTHTARLRRSFRSRHVTMRKPRFERQAWSPPWAAQPAHAADHLPRRVRKDLALASRLLEVYTCRQSCPARSVAVWQSLFARCVVGRKTAAADARPLGGIAPYRMNTNTHVRQLSSHLSR